MTDDRAGPDTAAALVLERRGDDHRGLLFEDRPWTWREVVAEAGTRASWLASLRRDRPVPRRRAARERARVPVRARRRGARRRGGRRHQPDPPRRRAGPRHPPHRLPLIVTDAAPRRRCSTASTSAARPPVARRRRPGLPASRSPPHAGAVRRPTSTPPDDLFLLIFTSGSTGAPKAVRMTPGPRRPGRERCACVRRRRRPLLRDAAVPRQRAQRDRLPRARDRRDASRCGARFSASQFMPDVRRLRRDVLQHRRPRARLHPRHARVDRRTATTTLKFVLGAGVVAAPTSRAFTRALRHPRASRATARARTPSSCSRRPALPTRRARACRRTGIDVAVVDPETGEERPRARFDADGRLLNADEAIGEIVGRNVGRPVRGLLQQPRGRRRAHPQRLVLVRRPRLPRRRRRLLLRRPQPATGSASTARTSPPRRSSGSSPASRRRAASRCTPCPTTAPPTTR